MMRMHCLIPIVYLASCLAHPLVSQFTESSDSENQSALISLLRLGATIDLRYSVIDTGQTTCYAGAPVTPCGDVSYPGQDADYVDTPTARLFVGPVAAGGFSSDYVVTDSATGLVWKACTEGQTGANCQSSGLSSDNYGADSSVATWTNAATACSALNAANGGVGYAGYTDWRLPTARELATLTDYGAASPSIDVTHFPAAVPQQYWTSTELASNTSNAWVVFFTSGFVLNVAKSGTNYVRCVASQSLRSPEFTDNGDGTISDASSRLVWQKCSNGQSNDTSCSGSPTTANWQSALQYCNTLSLSGKSWRLPSAAELLSLVDFTQTGTVINGTFFPNTAANLYWTSTTNQALSGAGWRVTFATGDLNTTLKAANSRMRCVANL